MTRSDVRIGPLLVGDDHDTIVVAEIGINHNGDLDLALRLIEAAARAGAHAVKFQKRTPELAVPPEYRAAKRDTPWGYISYLDYRHKIELGRAEYDAIDRFCRQSDIAWFASVWDEPSVTFMEPYDLPCYKVPSAALTDHALLRFARSTGRPLILSTGMSTQEQMDDAVRVAGTTDLVVTHSTSAYPCDPSELNLRMIPALRDRYPVPIGYSGHETGLVTSALAVALGAAIVERHITLDRAMWGTDQAASVEPEGFQRLVKYVRVTRASLGDGIKRVYPSEYPAMERLRRRG